LFYEKHYYLKNDKDKKFLIKSLRPSKVTQKLPVILLMHGMNFFGMNDPRIVHLGKSLTLCGFNVLIPEISEIKKSLITLDTLKSLNDFFSIYQNNITHQDVRLFLISFSGGMSLISIADKKFKNNFKSIISLGSYSDFEKTIPYVLNNFENDNYGTNIFLYNYIDLILKNNRIKNYFYDCIIYNLMKISNYDVYLKIKNNLSKQEQNFCNKIEKNIYFRLEIGNEIIKIKKDLIRKISPINYVQNIDSNCNLFFIHGNQDKIISKEESINMYQKVAENKKNKLMITNLIDHGNNSFNFKKLNEIPKIVSIFNEFLNTGD
jgi:esterase/lipase